MCAADRVRGNGPAKMRPHHVNRLIGKTRRARRRDIGDQER
ncbi:hypothetical protein AB0D04_38750 [Streptomyces sp. NPDC048483]